jgi:hypothetical protein
MSLIDAPKLAEFLDDNKNEKLNLDSVRTDSSLLNKAGVSVRESGRKSGKTIRILEYFLLRSYLYQSEGNALIPYMISSNWPDFARGWKTKVDGEEIHIPFLGKIAFLCKTNGAKKIVCHPDSVADIDKICVDTGMLTFQKDPVDKINLMYRPKACELILDMRKRKKLTEDFLQEENILPFSRALVSIGLAQRKGTSLKLEGDGLLLTEMKKIEEDDDLEKVGRLILRNEQKKQAQISSVIVCIEYFERQAPPFEKAVGAGPRYRESKRTKKRYENLGHYQMVENICSIDNRVATNVLSVRGDSSPGFAAFGAILDTYHRTIVKAGQDWAENFSFLTWYTDSLSYLTLSSERLIQLNWSEAKTIKTKRHRAFLSRFVNDKALHIASQKDLMKLQSNCKKSEFIDMNIDLNRFPQLRGHTEVEYCSSNVFAASKVPVERDFFESMVLRILQSPSGFKDAQGSFYYPDFRFIVASTLGLSLGSVDHILAYVISTGSDLGRRLWFFPAFGKIPRRDRPAQELADVVLRPFDSIILNY